MTWEPVKAPPLRSDLDRRRREYRRHLRRVERAGWLTLTALVGIAAGALTAVYTCPGVLA